MPGCPGTSDVARAQASAWRHTDVSGWCVPRREDIWTTGEEFLQEVVRGGAGDARPFQALLLGHRHIHGQGDGGRSVHGERRAGLFQGESPEDDLHILQGIHRHPDHADFLPGPRIVGIQPDLGRQVKGDQKAALALIQQVAKAFMGLVRRPNPAYCRTVDRRPAYMEA